MTQDKLEISLEKNERNDTSYPIWNEGTISAQPWLIDYIMEYYKPCFGACMTSGIALPYGCSRDVKAHGWYKMENRNIYIHSEQDFGPSCCHEEFIER